MLAAAAVSVLGLVAATAPGIDLPTWAEQGGHFAGFSCFALAWGLALPRHLPWVAAGCAVLAAGSEWAQATWLTARTGSLEDALTNLAGAALGLAIAAVVASLGRRVRQERG